MYTDSHCHLSFPELVSQLPDIRQKMEDAHVTRALCICTTIEEFDQVHHLAKTYDNFWSTVGVHPDNEDIYEPSVQDLVDKGLLPRVIAIGETGLDYYQMSERKGGRSIEDMEWQRDRFRNHIRAARQIQLPMVIHTRASSEDTIRILKEEGEAGDASSAGGVFHCFTESQAVAKAALDLGFYLSLGDTEELGRDLDGFVVVVDFFGQLDGEVAGLVGVRLGGGKVLGILHGDLTHRDLLA